MNGPSKGYLYNLTDLARSQTLEDSLWTGMRAVGKDTPRSVDFRLMRLIYDFLLSREGIYRSFIPGIFLERI